MSDASESKRAAGDAALTAAEVAALVGGTLEGDGGAIVRGVAPLVRARRDQATFLADARYAPLMAESEAGTVLLTAEFAKLPCHAQARVVVAKPYDALVMLLPKLYRADPRPVGVHPTAQIAAGARIGDGATVEAFAIIGEGATVGDRAWIGPHCVVGPRVTIGADSRLVSHVTCYPGTEIGERVVLHSGVRTGSDGFGYSFGGGAHQKILHVGRCIISNDVEIGANTCIDRGSIDDTVIGAGTKIDNLVHIAHNVQIGRLCLLMAQVGVAGSSRVGDGAILAGQVGIAGHVHIGAGARVAAQAGVISDIPAGETWSGYPARPHRQAMRASAALFKLEGMIRQLEKLLEERS